MGDRKPLCRARLRGASTGAQVSSDARHTCCDTLRATFGSAAQEAARCRTQSAAMSAAHALQHQKAPPNEAARPSRLSAALATAARPTERGAGAQVAENAKCGESWRKTARSAACSEAGVDASARQRSRGGRLRAGCARCAAAREGHPCSSVARLAPPRRPSAARDGHHAGRAVQAAGALRRAAGCSPRRGGLEPSRCACCRPARAAPRRAHAGGSR
jgi:hypothetical protein